MPAITATAPGKIILFGEHAVVYGQPAIAAPVQQVQARAVVSANPRSPGGAIHIQAPDIRMDAYYSDLAPDHPLARVVSLVLETLGVARPPAMTLRITSTIPPAAGMGSGAAVSVACIRALSAFLGRPLPDKTVSALAYEVEKIYHGTPSGIDNTTITYARPVYFVRDKPIRTLKVGAPFTVVIGDTGIASSTAKTVGDVRRGWQVGRARFEALFSSIGQLSKQARSAIQKGKPELLGPLMDENHACLQQMGVSTRQLDRLVEAARQAGALGAKLSGGGRGGNMIALVSPGDARQVGRALQASGAANVIITEIR